MRCAPDSRALVGLLGAMVLSLACGTCAAAPLPATLESAFEEALHSRPDIAQADSKIRSAELNETVRRSVFYPSISLGASAGLGESPQYIRQSFEVPQDVTATINGMPVDRARVESLARGTEPAPTGLQFYRAGRPITIAELQNEMLSQSSRETKAATSSYSSYQQGISLGLNYSIYSGGSDMRGLQLSRLQRNEAEVERLSAVKKALEEVARAYYQLQTALAQEDFDRRSLDLSQRKLASLAPQFADGHVSRNAFETATLQLELQQLQIQRHQLETDARRLAYCASLSRAICPELERRAWAPQGKEDPLPPSFMKLAQNVSASVKSRADDARELKRLEVDEARSAYLPRVGAGASLCTSGGSSSGFREAFSNTRYRGWQVGVYLSWTIFDGFRTSASMDLAKLSQADTERQIEQQLMAHDQELQRARMAERQAELACKTARLQWTLTRTQYEQEATRHRLGAAALQVALEAELKHEEAAFALRKQRMDLRLAQLQQLALGGSPREEAVLACDMPPRSVAPLSATAHAPERLP